MDRELLSRYISAVTGAGAPSLPKDQLLELTRMYPRWAAPAISLLRDENIDLDADTRERLRATVALNTTDLTSRAALTADRGAIFSRFYPQQPASTASTTDDAISTFLENYGHPSPEEDRLLEQMIFNPVPDYGAVLAVDDETEPPDAIGDFVKAFTADTPSAPPETPSEPSPAPTPDKNTSLNESLAKIYIKQRRYNKAYEIILHLYLNNPKKSIYFADQLRFLRKLMLNSGIEPTKQTIKTISKKQE